ncbi:MAG: hypothetical protein U9O95_07770 [Candidatus Marinimicrobia bacterium]|nr:hypothetical protein [Candidatus Neomarinimicrobiota bacterium]
MIKECKEAGISNPKYNLDMSGFFVTFRKDIYTEEYLGSLGLNDRQVKAVLFVKEKTKISNSQYQEINDISKPTATRDLRELVEEYHLFEKSGKKGAGSYYKLIGS